MCHISLLATCHLSCSGVWRALFQSKPTTSEGRRRFAMNLRVTQHWTWKPENLRVAFLCLSGTIGGNLFAHGASAYMTKTMAILLLCRSQMSSESGQAQFLSPCRNYFCQLGLTKHTICQPSGRRNVTKQAIISCHHVIVVTYRVKDTY